MAAERKRTTLLSEQLLIFFVDFIGGLFGIVVGYGVYIYTVWAADVFLGGTSILVFIATTIIVLAVLLIGLYGTKFIRHSLLRSFVKFFIIGAFFPVAFYIFIVVFHELLVAPGPGLIT